MAWPAEDRRKYAPAIQDMGRGGMIARLARTIDAIDPRPKVGRQRAGSGSGRQRSCSKPCGTWPATAARGDACRASSRPPRASGAGFIAGGGGRAVLDRASAVAVARLRLAKGRQRRRAAGGGRRAAAIVDTQSVRTGPRRGPRGYDAGKKVKGRKRVLLIDTEGGPLGIRPRRSGRHARAPGDARPGARSRPPSPAPADLARSRPRR